MHQHIRLPGPMVSIVILVHVMFLALAQSVLAEEDDNVARLIAEWPDHIELPPTGQAVLRVNGQILVFEDITTCGLVEGAESFLMRAERKDEQGRIQSFRMYRRLAGDRSAMVSEEDLVQLAVRDHDSLWAHSLMQLKLQQPGSSVTRIHGNSDGWPAVNVRYRGTGAWARGEMVRRVDSSEVVPAGDFFAVVHCSQEN